MASAHFQGVVVREEDDIFVIWTKALNHIYVRKENFNSLEHYLYDWVDVLVLRDSSAYGDYRYEGVRVTSVDPLNSQSPITSPDEEYNDVQRRRMVCDFSKCTDNSGRPTLRWRDKFEISDEFASGSRAGIIRSVPRPNGRRGFIEKAIIPGGDRDQLVKNGITTFDGFVMLTYCAAEGNDTPWKLHKYYIDGEMDINGFLGRSGCLLRGPGGVPISKDRAQIPPDALRPKATGSPRALDLSQVFGPRPTVRNVKELWGFCVAKYDGYFGFYTSATIRDGKFSSCLLKLDLSYHLKVGSWYKFHCNVPEEYILKLGKSAASIDVFDSFEECSAPDQDDMIFRLIPCADMRSPYSTKREIITMIIRATVQLEPVRVSSKHLSESVLLDLSGEISQRTVEYMRLNKFQEARFIIEVVVSSSGFVITRAFDHDDGNQPLDTFLSQSEFPPDENRNDTIADFDGLSAQDSFPSTHCPRSFEDSDKPIIFGRSKQLGIAKTIPNSSMNNVDETELSNQSLSVSEMGTSRSLLESPAMKGLLKALSTCRVKETIDNEGMALKLEKMEEIVRGRF